MPYNSHRTGPDRVFDHLYDPLYITSGTKDIWKENHNALYRSAPVRIYPQFGTMFTDLPRRPRNYYIQQRNPLPHFPFVDEQGNYNLANQANGRQCRTAVIGGRDRAKFFNIPLNNEVNLNLQLDIEKKHDCCGQQSLTPVEAFRTVACETMYREQSAQTKPWMPDALVDDTESPELLYAAKTITSNAVPGILEVKQIERARRRRQLEKTFAESKYANDWTVRRAFCEAMEWEDRVAREEELDYCQQLRLGMVQKMMNSRQMTMQDNFSLQMDSTIKRLEADKERKLNNLRINHQRTLRRLDKEFGEKAKRSKVLTQQHQQTSFVSYNTDFEARLDELHKMPTMPTNLERFTQPKIDITKPKQPIKEVKKGLWTEKCLVHLYESLKVIQKKIIHQRTAKCLIDIREEVLSYVSTTRPSFESYENELEYQHAVFLQKLIKGRAIQSILHDGKDAHQELIDQLKKTFKLESVWRAECADDWNEEKIRDFLGTYIDQEFVRYSEQKQIYDRRRLAEQEKLQKEAETDNQIRKEKEEVASDCWDEVFTGFFQNIFKSDTTEHTVKACDTPLNEQSSQIIVPHLLNELVLPEIYKNLEKENQSEQIEPTFPPPVTDENTKERIVKDAIEHILRKVIPHPAEVEASDLIDDIVKKTIELSSSIKELNADSLDNEIGGMLDDLCNQLLKDFERNDDMDESGSECDSPDE